uniref:Uncharacterized protein n=1 Tax=Rhizophora mucronata TaxID=61149 RepID=A0A2P2R4Q1_RHIMU
MTDYIHINQKQYLSRIP